MISFHINKCSTDFKMALSCYLIRRLFITRSSFGFERNVGSYAGNAAPDDLAIITAPQKMIQKLDRQRRFKTERERRPTRPRTKGPLIISCQRKDYNFHKNERFNKESDFYKLVSCGWRNRKRNGDQFTLVSHSKNPSLQTDDENAVLFSDLGLKEDLCDKLHSLGYQLPTQIQKLAIPAIIKGEHTICAAETGSGKTVAYLSPVIERIAHQKSVLKGHNFNSDSRTTEGEETNLAAPHTVILSPNRELTEQVMNVAESLLPENISAQCVVGGKLKKSDLSMFKDYPMDILITTPGILNKMLDTRVLRKSNLQSLVIDEADTLLDDSFINDIHKIFYKFQVSLSDQVAESNAAFGEGIQLSLVSATMPRDLHSTIGHIIPVEAMTKATTDGLHHLMPHVPQTFHRINPDSKPEKLIQLLKKNLEKGQVNLVFTKGSKTCFYLKRLLKDNEIDCLTINGELTAKEREGLFLRFKEGYCDTLVATDIASRGLDTTNVHHVINYDFPTFLSDYVHRVGRVGRVGSQHTGQVTSFVSHNWDVELLWKIEMAARMGKQLHNVNANIKRKLEGLHGRSDVFTVNEMS